MLAELSARPRPAVTTAWHDIDWAAIPGATATSWGTMIRNSPVVCEIANSWGV